MVEEAKTVSQFIDIELRRGKSYQPAVSWGRRVLTAIDCNDYIRLAQLFDPRKTNDIPVLQGDGEGKEELEREGERPRERDRERETERVELKQPKAKKSRKAIDIQVNYYGYAGYLWTRLIHNFLGDTVLHFALRQRRKECVYMLLLLSPDLSLANAKGETASALCLSTYQQDAINMKFDAERQLIEVTPPSRLNELPDMFRAKGAEEEAWRLMRAGRLLYTELPRALQTMSTVDPLRVTDNTRKRLSFNVLKGKAKDARAHEVAAQDIGIVSTTDPKGDSSAAPVNATHKKEGLTPEQEEEMRIAYEELKEKAKKWIKKFTDDGNFYFVNTETGETSQDAPPGWRDEGTTEVGYTGPGGTTVSGPPGSRPRTAGTGGRTDTASVNTGGSFDDIIKNMANADKHLSTAKKGDQKKTTLSASHQREEFLKSRPKLALDDCWTKGTFEDVVQLLERQKRTHALRTRPPEQYLAKGLSLLSHPLLTRGTGNVLEDALRKEAMVNEGRRDLLTTITQSVDLERAKHGLTKLRSTLKIPSGPIGVESSKVANISREKAKGREDLLEIASRLQDPKFLTAASMQSVIAISDQILFRERVLAYKNQPYGDGSMAERYTPASALPVGLKYISHDDDVALVQRALAVSAQNERDRQKAYTLSSSNTSNDGNITTILPPNTTTSVVAAPSTTTSIPITVVETITPIGPATTEGTDTNATVTIPIEGQTVVPGNTTAAVVLSSVLGTGTSSVALGEGEREAERQLGTMAKAVGAELWREITEVSTYTNLKHMLVGDQGTERLSIAFTDDPIVEKVCLSRAGVTDVGVRALSESLPTMKALRVLDLSQNAITDDGVYALAKSLPHCLSLRRLSLAGNRLGIVGVLNVLQNVLDLSLPKPYGQREKDCKAWIGFLSLRNQIAMDDVERETALKMLEERGFIAHTHAAPPRLRRAAEGEGERRFVLLRDSRTRTMAEEKRRREREKARQRDQIAITRSFGVDWARERSGSRGGGDEKESDAEDDGTLLFLDGAEDAQSVSHAGASKKGFAGRESAKKSGNASVAVMSAAESDSSLAPSSSLTLSHARSRAKGKGKKKVQDSGRAAMRTVFNNSYYSHYIDTESEEEEMRSSDDEAVVKGKNDDKGMEEDEDVVDYRRACICVVVI